MGIPFLNLHLMLCGLTTFWLYHYILFYFHFLSNWVVDSVRSPRVLWSLLFGMLLCDTVASVHSVQRWKVSSKTHRLHSHKSIFRLRVFGSDCLDIFFRIRLALCKTSIWSDESIWVRDSGFQVRKFKKEMKKKEKKLRYNKMRRK